MSQSLISSLLFPVPAPSYSYYSYPDELLWIPLGTDYSECRTGNSIPAVLLRSAGARYLVIYFHSNGEDVGLSYPFGCGVRMVLEVHVLLVEYPGYGICPGECSEDSLWRAANAAFRFVCEVIGWPADDVILMGRSLGAAVATRLACSVKCHGLILVAPFLSLVDAVSQFVGGLAPMFVKNMFCNRERIGNVKVPTLVIHGKKDRLVPCDQGKQLYELCPHYKKLYVSPSEMGHNSDLLSDADFLIRPMLRFFNLPDYSFVDLFIPPEAFDKRHCPQYHGLVEMARGDAPLERPVGDQEPCPPSTTTEGPQWHARSFPIAGGDVDDLDGAEEHTVRTPRGRGGSTSREVFGGVGPTRPSPGRVRSAREAGQAPDGAPDAGIPPLLEQTADSLSTTVGSSTLRQSDSSAGDARSGEDVSSLPGLLILDISHGISRFLGEAGPSADTPG